MADGSYSQSKALEIAEYNAKLITMIKASKNFNKFQEAFNNSELSNVNPYPVVAEQTGWAGVGNNNTIQTGPSRDEFIINPGLFGPETHGALNDGSLAGDLKSQYQHIKHTDTDVLQQRLDDFTFNSIDQSGPLDFLTNASFAVPAILSFGATLGVSEVASIGSALGDLTGNALKESIISDPNTNTIEDKPQIEEPTAPDAEGDMAARLQKLISAGLPEGQVAKIERGEQTLEDWIGKAQTPQGTNTRMGKILEAGLNDKQLERFGIQAGSAIYNSIMNSGTTAVTDQTGGEVGSDGTQTGNTDDTLDGGEGNDTTGDGEDQNTTEDTTQDNGDSNLGDILTGVTGSGGDGDGEGNGGDQDGVDVDVNDTNDDGIDIPPIIDTSGDGDMPGEITNQDIVDILLGNGEMSQSISNAINIDFADGFGLDDIGSLLASQELSSFFTDFFGKEGSDEMREYLQPFVDQSAEATDKLLTGDSQFRDNALDFWNNVVLQQGGANPGQGYVNNGGVTMPGVLGALMDREVEAAKRTAAATGNQDYGGRIGQAISETMGKSISQYMTPNIQGYQTDVSAYSGVSNQMPNFANAVATELSSGNIMKGGMIGTGVGLLGDILKGA